MTARELLTWYPDGLFEEDVEAMIKNVLGVEVLEIKKEVKENNKTRKEIKNE